MIDTNVHLPSKPKIILEEEFTGTYEIDGLYPGYGHTLGNSLRRIILSSLPGAAIVGVKIEGINHEFSTISGVKEDVITFLLHLKKVRFKLLSDEPQTVTLEVKGVKDVTAKDIKLPGQVEILNPELHLATLTDKGAELKVELIIEKGLGYVSKDELHKDRVDIGMISLDAIFTPIRRVNYEVENTRVGDRTDFNRLKIFIETDGTITPREALEKSIEIMINQLKSIIGFKESESTLEVGEVSSSGVESSTKIKKSMDADFLKTRVESLELSPRTATALANANIRTIGGLARKKEDDLLDIDGLGNKGIQEIKRALGNFGITLK